MPRVHLWRCGACRTRVAHEEMDLVRRFQLLEASTNLPLPDHELSRQRLLRNMRQAAKSPAGRSAPATTSPSRPALISAGMLAACALFLFLIASPRRPQPRTVETVDDVIGRATAAQENPGPNTPSGVIVQQIEVRSRGQRVEWPVYRDRQGQRKSRLTPVASREAALQKQLALADVPRDNPLAVASFNHWRVSLPSRRESLVSSGSGLVTITASALPGDTSLIASQSLTLRTSDYHPIAREVAFRDRETMEIAELDFKIIPWTQAQRDWFDAAPRQPSLPPLRAALSTLTPPTPLSPEELELAELQARMVLTQQDADTSEQIDLSQHPETVLVHGLASTAERKQQLQAALLAIPHVSVDLQTPAERENSESSPPPSHTTAIKMIGSVSQPSPLLLYWKSQHRNPEDFAPVSRRLMDASLRIRQQSHALRELNQAPALRNALQAHNPQVEHAYQALWQEHLRKLRTAIDDQAAILKIIAPTSHPDAASAASESPAEKPGIDTLDRMAADALATCRKLSAGDDSASTEALPLLEEISRASTSIATALNSLSTPKN